MALVLADRVRDTTTTTGTGTVTLSGTAPTGYQDFSVIGNGNTTYYTINAGSQFEVGIGTYSSTGPTLARNTVLESSNANALVNFSVGTKDVFVTYPSDKAVYQDGATIAAGTAVLGVTNGGTGVTTSTGTTSVVLSNSPVLVTPTLGAASATSIANGLGAVGTPSYTFTGDTNTGMFSPGADTLAFSEGGVEAMRITSAGNVGIGTTAPGVKLDVQGSGTVTIRSLSTDTSGVTVGILRADHGSGSSLQVRAGVGFTNLISTGAADPLILSTNSAERMRVTSGGDVGIGTSSPGKKLDVVGQFRVSSSAASGYALLEYGTSATATNNWHSGSEGDGTFRWYNGSFGAGTERMRITSAGNVGIGTTTPLARLFVETPASTGASFAYAANSNGAYPTGVFGGSFGYNFSAGGAEVDFWNGWTGATGAQGGFAFRRQTGASSQNLLMTIRGDGNVGIGTSSPLYQATVLGLGQETAAMTDAGNKGGSLYLQATGITSGSGGALLFGTTFGNQTPFAAIKGLVTDGATNTIGDLAFSTRNAPSDTALTERMRILRAGNVGIGTSAPATKLDVSSGSFNIVSSRSTTSFAAFQRFAPSGQQAYDFYMINGVEVARITADGANLLAFSTGSAATERMRIDNAGNVGIGTSSPGYKLDVNGTGYFNSSVQFFPQDGFRFTSASAVSAMRFGSAGTGEGTAEWSYNRSSGFAALSIGSTGSALTEIMRAQSGGNVGIGTSAPGAKLDVVGVSLTRTDSSGGSTPLVVRNDSTANNTTKATGLLFQGVDTVGTGKNTGVVQCGPSDANYVTSFLAFQTRTADALAERMRITSAGFVGIGTTAPSTRLHAQNVFDGTSVISTFENISNVSVNTAAAIDLKADQATTRLTSFRDGSGTSSSFSISPSVAGVITEAVRVTSTGNVGIGTSGPGYRLDVASGDTTASIGYAMRIRSNATATAAAVQFTNSAVSAQNGLITCTDTGGMTIQSDGASSLLAFRTNGSERARITAGGELLVGTTTGGRTVCISSADNWIRMSNASRSYLIGNSNSSAFNIFDETGGATRFQIADDGTANVFGLLVGRSSASTDVNTANDTGSFSVRGSTTTIASMSFHRTGAFAINMGLGTDNVFRIGGWSASSNAFQMDSGGNLTMLGNVTAYSDARIKKDVETIDSALDLVSKMRGVRYTRIDNDKRGVGVIAQEMLEVCPEVVQQGVGDDDTLSVAYGNLVGVLIEAVKELTARVAELEGK